MKFKGLDCFGKGFTAILRGWGFERVERGFRPLAEFIQLPNQEDLLANCCDCSLNEKIFIRSAAVDSRSKGGQLLSLLQELECDVDEERFSFVQVDPVETNWEQISSEHSVLHFLSDSFVHISLPLESYYEAAEKEFQPAQVADAVRKLPCFQNTVGWLQYCRWLNEEIDLLWKYIHTADLEEYALEAHFDDFRHELNSAFLKKTVDEIHAEMKTIRSLEESSSEAQDVYDRLIQSEKHLFALRYELIEMLKRLHVILKAIVREERLIEQSHPQFTGVRQSAELLALLLSTQVFEEKEEQIPPVQRLALLAVLNHLFHVKTAVSGKNGVERVSLASSVVLAVEALFGNHSTDEVVELALNWGSASALKDEFVANVKELFEKLSIPLIKAQDSHSYFSRDEKSSVSKTWSQFNLKI